MPRFSPAIFMHREAKRMVFTNRFTGRRVQCQIDGIPSGVTLDDVGWLPEEEVTYLQARNFIVEESAECLCDVVASQLSPFPTARIHDAFEGKHVLLGLPYSHGSTRSLGSKEAPNQIRLELPKRENGQVVDLGNAITFTGIAQGTQFEAYTGLARRIVTQGGRPIFLGGDHSISFASMRGVVSSFPAASITRIVLDAHADLGVEGIDDLLMASRVDFLNHTNVNLHCAGLTAHRETYVLGVRDGSTSPLPNVKLLSPAQSTLHELRHIVERSGPIYLSVDVDVISSTYYQACDYPSSGGLSPNAVEELLRLVITSGKVVGCDFTEFNPRKIAQATEREILVRLMQTLLMS